MSQKQEIEKLISKLQDEDKDSRASVVWTLGWMVEEEVVDAEPALIQALQDSNPEVRAAVAPPQHGVRHSSAHLSRGCCTAWRCGRRRTPGACVSCVYRARSPQGHGGSGRGMRRVVEAVLPVRGRKVKNRTRPRNGFAH